MFLLAPAIGVLQSNCARAQANLPIYTDHLVNGFQDWSWYSARNWSATNYVHSGAFSVATTITAPWGAISFQWPAGFNSALYQSVSFWINGGDSGGQRLQVYGTITNSAVFSVPIKPLVAHTWQQVVLSLSTLKVSNKTNFTGFFIQDDLGQAQPTFYVDDVELVAAPAPPLVHLGVDASRAVRLADARWFGINNAIWDELLDTAGTVSLLNEMGFGALRFPGGSLSDEYNWVTDTTDANTWAWPSPFGAFVNVATNVGAQTCITVNYGTGTPEEAAAWVASANQTNHYGFEYWEIGNELYGSWEVDSNSLPHDPYTYAVRSQAYLQQMKAVDPTIKIGLVVTPGETSFANYTNHPAYNARTQQTNYGWTAVLLTTLKNLGFTPDFLIHHRYPQNPGQESDPFLLQCSTGWGNDAADLRQQINDYFGPGGAGIELICTEHNSVSSNPGKQSTSLTEALFYADSYGQMMQTEFNGLFWFDFRNVPDAGQNNDPSLYGWRLYGDYGVVDGQTDRYPSFYAGKLMQYFVRGGDTVLKATSDYVLLSAYAARRTNGSLTVLVLNKDPTTNFTAQIALTNFIPSAAATVHFYGMPQDNAMDSGIGSPDIAVTNDNGAAASFTRSFPPYSLTLFTLAPAPPQLQAVSASGGQVVMQLGGQPGTPYVLETSTDLAAWTPTSTNTLAGGVLYVTNAVSPAAPARFWRAVWMP